MPRGRSRDCSGCARASASSPLSAPSGRARLGRLVRGDRAHGGWPFDRRARCAAAAGGARALPRRRRHPARRGRWPEVGHDRSGCPAAGAGTARVAQGPRPPRHSPPRPAELGSGVSFEVTELTVGGRSIDEHGVPLLPEVLERCRAADAILLGAVGGPKWDTTDPDAPRPEQGLLGLRKGLGLFANLRPVRPSPALLDASPLRRERIEGTDLLVVRELTGGIYFGERGREDSRAFDTCVYTVDEIT